MYCMDYNKKGKEQSSTSEFLASANAVANDKVTLWVWDSEKLTKALNDDRALSNAFAAYCNYDLREKLLKANKKYNKIRNTDQGSNGGDRIEASYWDFIVGGTQKKYMSVWSLCLRGIYDAAMVRFFRVLWIL